MTLKTTMLPYNLQLEEGERLALPDDPPPLPDAMLQNPSIIYAYNVIATHFHVRPDVFVDTNTFVYYDRTDRQRRIAPDLYVALGVDAAAIRRRNGYVIREVGKPPDFVLEVASETTAAHDLRGKRDLYAVIGVGEYWRFDPSGGDYYGEPLVGETLVDGEYRRLELQPCPEGLVSAYSPLLDREVQWEGGRLWIADPRTGERGRDHTQSEAERKEERRGRLAAEVALAASEAENRSLREQLRRLREC